MNRFISFVAVALMAQSSFVQALATKKAIASDDQRLLNMPVVSN